jgi:hypothetical protein
MSRRFLGALLAASALVAAFPAAASAAFVVVVFTTGPQASSTVDAVDFDAPDALVIELVRDGKVIASATGTVEVPELQAGDTARVLGEGGAVRGSATYDGTPAILGDACIGSTSFRAARSAPGFEFEAGAGVLIDEGYGTGIDSTVGEGSPAVVTLSRPLAAGDGVYVAGSALSGEVVVSTAQVVAAKDCTTATPPKPGQDQPKDPDAPKTGDGPQRATLSVAAAAARLKRLGLARLGRSRAFALPVAFTQPGAATFKLLARGKVIGKGTRSATAGDRRVTVTLTRAGRKLLKRATRLKLTLKGTFTPSRAGEAPQRASVSVTLRR